MSALGRDGTSRLVATAGGGRALLWRGVAASFLALVAVCVSAGSVLAAASPAVCPNRSLRGGASAALPDCRAYERVSPANKGGYNAVNWLGPAPAQAAANGSRIFYEGLNAYPGAEGNNAVAAGHLGFRTGEGWQAAELLPHSAEPTPEGEYFDYYPALSEDLTQVVVKVPLALTESASPRAWNIYTRQVGESQTMPPQYQWVNDIQLATPAAPLCEGGAGEPSCYTAVGFAGASRDFSHIFFESSTHLLAESPAQGVEALYENAAGQVRLVGVLPDGRLPASGATAGSGSDAEAPTTPGAKAFQGDARVQHAVSINGQRVVFEAKSDEGKPAEAGQGGLVELYDRIDNSTSEPATVELSAPAAGAAPKVTTPEAATFWDASSDGTRIFFTSSAELTSESNTGPANEGTDLYEATLAAQTEGTPKVHLRDLTVDPAASAGAQVLGVVGVSEGGGYVYFVAKGQLVAGKGVSGEPNLYMEHDGGKPVFIATLASANATNPSLEEEEPGDSLDWTAYSRVQRAYLAPDGRHLAFMSVNRLPTTNFPSGYDNEDLASGKADSEVYEYSAPSGSEEAAGAIGSLTCVSCAANGARPAGPAFIAGSGEGTGVRRVAVSASTPFYHVRAMSENGSRVFFSAPPFASEVAADGEETQAAKIYEHESDGEGSCRQSTGCVFRLSAASNPTPDIFLDASATGNDVFFATYSQLVPADRDKLVDVYDARVNGGIAESAQVPECSSRCREAGGGAPGGPPLVSGLTGPSGNLVGLPLSQGTSPPAKTVRGAKSRSKARKRLLVRCRKYARRLKSKRRRKHALKACRRHRARAVRHRHRGRARRRGDARAGTRPNHARKGTGR